MMRFLMQKISSLSRVGVLAIAILVVPVFFLPLWHISLTAPQYPEGLGMYIYIDDIRGANPNDLKNINLLNHYVGMKEIVKESIPELLYMPWLLGYLIFGAVVTLIFPRLIMVILGIVNMSLLSVAGLYDFWRWEYNYGHNLNPEAPIIIPGMSYQPPLLFCKTILNISACSFPHFGAIILSLSLAILVAILIVEKRRFGKMA